jgi:hypothetical protein
LRTKFLKMYIFFPLAPFPPPVNFFFLFVH